MGDHTTPTTVCVDSLTLRSIAAHVIACAPEEACGVLVGESRPDAFVVEQAVAAANVSPGDRTQFYEVDPQAVVDLLLQARPNGGKVLGFYHSHPRGPAVPSGYDLDCAWRDRVYLIVGVGGDGNSATPSFSNSGALGGPVGPPPYRPVGAQGRGTPDAPSDVSPTIRCWRLPTGADGFVEDRLFVTSGAI